MIVRRAWHWIVVVLLLSAGSASAAIGQSDARGIIDFRVAPSNVERLFLVKSDVTRDLTKSELAVPAGASDRGVASPLRRGETAA